MASGVMAFRGAGGTSRLAPGRCGTAGRSDAVANEEQVAQHLHLGIALLAFAQQRGHRHVQVLAQQIEQGRLDRGDGVDGGAQVEGLQAPAAGSSSAPLPCAAGPAFSCADGWPTTSSRGVFQRLADLLAAGHPAHRCSPALSFSMTRLRVKNGAWAPAQVQQHAGVPKPPGMAPVHRYRGGRQVRGEVEGHAVRRGNLQAHRPVILRAGHQSALMLRSAISNRGRIPARPGGGELLGRVADDFKAQVQQLLTCASFSLATMAACTQFGFHIGGQAGAARQRPATSHAGVLDATLFQRLHLGRASAWRWWMASARSLPAWICGYGGVDVP